MDYSFKICEDHPKARDSSWSHGVINWADSDRECYEWTVEIIQKADAAYLAKHDKKENLHLEEISILISPKSS